MVYVNENEIFMPNISVQESYNYPKRCLCSKEMIFRMLLHEYNSQIKKKKYMTHTNPSLHDGKPIFETAKFILVISDFRKKKKITKF